MTRTNTILTIPAPRRTALKEVPYPVIKPGFALVEVAIAPICIEHQGYRDHNFEWHEDSEHLGHEGVGTVIETAEGSKFAVGDRVIMYQGNPCGRCFVCEQGLSPTHCLTIPYESIEGGANPHAEIGGIAAMATPGGIMSIEKDCGSLSGGYGFSRYRIVPERMAQRIPDGLSFRHAAAANCCCGCTFTGVEEMGVRAGDVVMVAGVGFIGFGAIINAKYRNATVIALGRTPHRMQMARDLGADHVVDPDDPDWLAQVHALTGGKMGVDHVFEASGHQYYQRRALQAVRRYGNLFMFGFLVGDDRPLPIHLLDEVHNRHVHITGGHDVRVQHRADLVRMLQDPEVQRKLDILITHEFNMSDADKAFEAILAKEAGKVFLYPGEDAPAR